MKDLIGVVGAGSWGTTLAWILAGNGHKVELWARDEDLCGEINAQHTNSRYLAGTSLPDHLHCTHDLAHICHSCELIYIVVPSHGFRFVARQMGEFLQGDQAVVHCTKGLELQTFKRMSEVLREETCLRKIGVLAGPNLAREIAAGNPAGTLVASRYEEVVRAAQATLHNPRFRVYGGTDVTGAEIGGSFKNIVAVAAGIVDGLHLGDNTKALLLTRSLNEMARLGSAMGADLVTFGGMAGIGDLMATCFSPLSRNHQVGERLAQGQSLPQIVESMVMVAEGVKTCAAVHQYARWRGMDLPIVTAVHRLLYEGATVGAAMDELLAVKVGREFPGLVVGG